MTWRVLHSDFNFSKDKREWNGTDISFDITRNGNKTELRFTHVGLVPANECYDVCSSAWEQYITRSLHKLITAGKAEPNPIENHAIHQEEIVEKVREKIQNLH